MKRLVTGVIAAAAFSASAIAADLTPSPDAGRSTAMSWTGLYLGAALGDRASDVRWATDHIFVVDPPLGLGSNHLDSSALRGSLHGGYNWQAGAVVVGFEGDVEFARSKRSISDLPGTTAAPYPQNSPDSMSMALDWDASLRARAGVLVAPSLLLYGTAGPAWQRASLNVTCTWATVGGWCGAVRNETIAKTLSGWTWGGGAEAMLTKNWLARIDFRHSEFGSLSHVFAPATFDEFGGAAKVKTNTLNFGLSYKF